MAENCPLTSSLRYLRNNLGEKLPTRKEFEQMKADLEKATEELKELRLEIRTLKGEPPLPEDGAREEADTTTTVQNEQIA